MIAVTYVITKVCALYIDNPQTLTLQKISYSILHYCMYKNYVHTYINHRYYLV